MKHTNKLLLPQLKWIFFLAGIPNTGASIILISVSFHAAWLVGVRCSSAYTQTLSEFWPLELWTLSLCKKKQREQRHHEYLLHESSFTLNCQKSHFAYPASVWSPYSHHLYCAYLSLSNFWLTQQPKGDRHNLQQEIRKSSVFSFNSWLKLCGNICKVSYHGDYSQQELSLYSSKLTLCGKAGRAWTAAPDSGSSLFRETRHDQDMSERAQHIRRQCIAHVQ